MCTQFQATLGVIRDNVNDVTLANAQARRKQKRKSDKTMIGGQFGDVTQTPLKKQCNDVVSPVLFA